MGASSFAPEQSFGVQTVLTPPQAQPIPGDQNGDGVIDLQELNDVIQSYRNLRP
jgi:hypothetical protein